MRREQPDKLVDRIERFVARLQPEERMLIVLKRELYDGNWSDMLADLRARLDGGPFMFSLADRIECDLARIEQLQAFEQDCRVDLAEYVNLESESAD